MSGSFTQSFACRKREEPLVLGEFNIGPPKAGVMDSSNLASNSSRWHVAFFFLVYLLFPSKSCPFDCPFGPEGSWMPGARLAESTRVPPTLNQHLPILSSARNGLTAPGVRVLAESLKRLPPARLCQPQWAWLEPQLLGGSVWHMGLSYS